MSVWVGLQTKILVSAVWRLARWGGRAAMELISRLVKAVSWRQAGKRAPRPLSKRERLASRWAVAAVAASVAIASTGLALKPAKAGPITVAFSPWVSFEEIVDRVYRAGGFVIARAEIDGVVVAIGPQDDAFHETLRAEGAYLIMNGEAGILLSSAD